MLKVTNLENNKSVIVKVTDRGPFRKGKIIDLSYRAAKEIGMLAQGVVLVEINVIKDNIVPLRPDEEPYKPFEFEMAESEVDYHHPQWQLPETQETRPSKETNRQKKEALSSPPQKHNVRE